uniref:BEN domain-containing protein n=1 Tax=Glossina brevipalpis TaxID=37001 RepID=A0A1A9WKL1_9MUSC
MSFTAIEDRHVAVFTQQLRKLNGKTLEIAFRYFGISSAGDYSFAAYKIGTAGTNYNETKKKLKIVRGDEKGQDKTGPLGYTFLEEESSCWHVKECTNLESSGVRSTALFQFLLCSILIEAQSSLHHINKNLKLIKNFRSFDESSLTDQTTVAARKLPLLATFVSITLATHSLTGKKAPAHPGREPKPILDERIIKDIIDDVRLHFIVEETDLRLEDPKSVFAELQNHESSLLSHPLQQLCRLASRGGFIFPSV